MMMMMMMISFQSLSFYFFSDEKLFNPHSNVHTYLCAHAQHPCLNNRACSLTGFQQAYVWDRLNIELELYVSMHFWGSLSLQGNHTVTKSYSV